MSKREKSENPGAEPDVGAETRDLVDRLVERERELLQLEEELLRRTNGDNPGSPTSVSEICRQVSDLRRQVEGVDRGIAAAASRPQASIEAGNLNLVSVRDVVMLLLVAATLTLWLFVELA